MGMMAKMRNLAPWFIITVGGLFVLFMVLSDSKVTEILGQRSRYIGSVNGDDITYQEFSSFVERARQNRLAQTGQDIDESQMDMFRDQVWDALINQKLMEQQIAEYGIEVTDDEIRDVIISDDPPAFLKQSFIDSTGTFNKEMYNQAIFDPRNKNALIQAEEAVKSDLLQKKLENYLFASVVVNDDEVISKFKDDNIKMSTEYALVESNTFADSLVTVADEDMQNYYDNHKEDYKIEAQRKVKYVLFRKAPSKYDTSAVVKNLESIVEKLKDDTASFKTYVEIYSDQPYARDTLSLSRIPKELQIITEAKPGDILGPKLTYEGAVVLRFVDSKKAKSEVVRASHILIKSTGENDAAAKAKADSVYEAIKNGADFAQTAKEVSEDFGSGAKGGDLGWFGKGQMVPPFEEACFSGKVGQLQKPIKTRFGYHIIEVTGKNDKDYIVEKITNKIETSASTMDKLYNDAADFAYLSNDNGYEESAEMLKYNILETPPFNEKAANIPGVGTSQALLHFAFDNGVGEISDVFKVTAGYVVAMVSEEIPEGHKTFEEVKGLIKRDLVKEKKNILAENEANKIKPVITNSGNFQDALTVYPKVKVNKAENFTAGGNIPLLGKDYAFINHSLDAPLNEIKGPFIGTRGSFLIKVLSRSQFDSTSFMIQKNNIRESILQRKKSLYLNDWMQSIKDASDIVDNRYQFYR